MNIGIFTAFLAGLLSFFSPCVFPLWSVYISVITGFSIDELTQQNQTTDSKQKFYILYRILFFILGFSLVFVLLGIFAKYLFSILFFNKQILNIISGVILFIFGCFLLFDIKTKTINFKFFSKNNASFLIGIIFAFGWTPCVGPILGSILTLASNEATMGKSIILLVSYSLGLAVPFLVTGLFFNFFIARLKYLNKYLPIIQKIVAVALLILGVLVGYGKIF